MSNLPAEEYCNHEVFRPECGRDEVIKMHRAEFGRGRMGRCIREEEATFDEKFMQLPGFHNCSADVRFLLEPRCAGRQQCSVAVAKIKVHTGCHKSFRYYLEASHSCVKSSSF